MAIPVLMRNGIAQCFTHPLRAHKGANLLRTRFRERGTRTGTRTGYLCAKVLFNNGSARGRLLEKTGAIPDSRIVITLNGSDYLLSGAASKKDR